MTSRPKIAIEKIFWRGAWILVMFADPISRYLFDEAEIEIHNDLGFLAMGKADSFYQTAEKENDRVMVDIAEFWQEGHPPTLLIVKFEGKKFNVPITLQSRIVEESEIRLAANPC